MSTTTIFKRTLATTSATMALAFGFAGQALAQTTADADTAVSEEEIVVTGSLIRNPNLEASSPVSVIGQDEIELQQANVAEELLRELPGATPSIGSAVNNGNGGASFVNLRGMGSNRNVVLLDGQRIAPSNFVGRVDLNNIPLALIQRTETLTGGASTTYGADAIAGVVNFITRKDFAGAEINVSEQITEEGDGNRFRADLTIGANFDDGRGNAVFSVGYQETDPVYQGARDISFLNVDSFTGVVGGGSNTAVPSVFSFARAGIVATSPAPDGVLGGNRQVDPALGGAVRTTGTNNIYAPFNFNPFNIFQTPFQRFNMFGQGNYEIADGVEIFTRGLFSKNTVKTIIAGSGVFATSVTIPVSNPFLSPALRAQFCASNDFQHGGANGSGANAGAVGNLNTAGIQTLTPAECAAAALATSPTDPNYRTFTTNLSRRAVEAGPRISDFRTQVFDYQVGLRGDLTDNLGYEFSGSYGESENVQTLQGYVLTSRARQALLATNATTCLNTANGCVPADFFGPEGNLSPAVNFLTAEATTTNRTSLAQVRGAVSGDVGFTSPWAGEAVGFAVGAEYRDYAATQKADSLSQTPGELGGSGGAAPNIDGAFNVKEVFGEIVAPIVEDKPFFESLSIEAGIRYSKYEVQAPGNPSYDSTTYKVGGQWEPGYGVKFRGQYARAVRAPNIGELFTPLTTGLTTLNTDPCQGAAPLNNAELRAICLAQGAPAFTIGGIQAPTSGQANVTAGGNLALKPEKADTYTFGVVLQPDFVPGLSLAIDWFDIRVNGAIGAPTTGDAIAACFGSTPTAPPAGASLTAACTGIGRDPNTGNLNGNPATTSGLFLSSSNLGTILTRGIDLSANYTRDIGFAKLALGFVGTWTKDAKFQATPTAINRECVGYYSPNCGSPGGLGTGSIQPEYQFSQRSTLSFGDVDVSLLWRFLDKVKFEPQQFADDLAAALADPTGCPDPQGADTGGCLVQPEFRDIGAYHYFDLSTRFGVTENISLTFSVENLFDKAPPLVGATVGTTAFNSGNTYPSTYDALGRKFAVSARVRF